MRYDRAADRAVQATALRHGGAFAPKLALIPVAQGVYIVTDEGSRPSPSRAAAMARHAGVAYFPRTEGALRMPGFGVPLAGRDREALHALRGATLLFPDAPPAALANLEELHKLRALGVRAVFVNHIADSFAIVRLEIRYFSRRRRLLNFLFLWLHALARFTTVESLGARLFRLRPYHVDGHRLETPRVPAIARAENTDLCERYGFFQGFTQLPPVPVSHEDIARRGGGAYSVWHQHVVFSVGRSAWRFFMLVPKNRWTERFFEMRCETSAPDPAQAKEWVVHVQEAASVWRRGGMPRTARDAPVVVLTHCLAPGGAERQWCYLAIGLKRLGREVSVVATHDVSGAGSHYLPLLRRHDVRFVALDEAAVDDPLFPLEVQHVLAPSANPFGERLARLACLLRTLRPGAVFAQLDAPNIMAAIAGHVADTPRVVLSFRNYNPTHFAYIHQDWMLPCYRALAASPRIALAGNSRAGNRDYAEWIGVPESDVHTVPNAVDAAGHEPVEREQRAALRASLGIDPSAPLVIGVFRLSDEKRPFDFLRVCQDLRQALPALRVLIVGEGPLRPRLEQALEPWIEILGRRSDVVELVQLADLLLLTSSHEGMPNVIMEAQLAGVPAVASRTGALPELVSEDSGVLVEPGNIAGFVDACLSILRNREAARAGCLRAAQRMREEFTIDRMTRRYLEIAEA